MCPLTPKFACPCPKKRRYLSTNLMVPRHREKKTLMMINQSLVRRYYCQSPFPRQMAHRAAPISVSITLGHASANAVKTTARGWSTGSSASLTFPLHSHISSARREGSKYHFKSLWYDSAGARTHELPVVR